MSDSLPALRADDVIRKLRRAGFVFDRHAKGSHDIWYNPTPKRRAIVPIHTGDIPKGTLRNIIRQSGLTVEEFVAL